MFLGYVALGILPLVAVWFYFRLRVLRFQYGSIPQLKSDFVWGHLKILNEYIQKGRKDEHIDTILANISRDLGDPSIFLIDSRPLMYPMVVITNHEVAEQVSRITKAQPWSTPKSPTIGEIDDLIGPHSILVRQGDSWKQLRKRFNPGFAPQHLMTLLPCILDKSLIFLEHLDAFCESNQVFSAEALATNLTFDIIGTVTLGVDFDAQHLEHSDKGEFIRYYHELLETFAGLSMRLPSFMFPRLLWRRRRVGKRVDGMLKDMIREKFVEQQDEEGKKVLTTHNGRAKPSRSIMNLALASTPTLTPDILADTCDQIKSFIFAGHDTTGILMSWLFYEIWRTPRALAAVRAELDAIFGPEDRSPAAVRAKLLAPGGDELVHRMTYISACLREALRLHPPAGTARMTKPGTGFALRTPEGAEHCVDGMIIYNCATIIQRDRNVYGETADDFVPERWLTGKETGRGLLSAEHNNVGADEKSGASTGGQIPASAWRPFERGPRNCIGQDMATIEARVILALVARHYDFVKVGLGEPVVDEKGQWTVDEKGQYKVREEMYATRKITAKPVDGMMMKVSLRKT